MRLRSKISISILSIVIVMFAAVTIYVGSTSSKKTQKDAQALAAETVGRVAKELEVLLTEELSSIETIASIVEQMDRSRPDAREFLEQILGAGATVSSNTLNMWAAFEQNSFDNRDAEYSGSEGHGPKGQVAFAVVDNKDGTYTRTIDVSEEVLYQPEGEAWYQVPLRTGQVTITEPNEYTYPDGTKLVISTICVPVRINGRVAGIVGADLEYSSIQKSLAEVRVVSDRSSLLLVANGGTVIYSTQADDIGGNVSGLLSGRSDNTQILNAIQNGKPYATEYKMPSSGEQQSAVYAPVTVGDARQHMSFNANIPVADMLTESRAMTRNIIIVSVAGILVLGAIIIWIIGRVVKPIVAMSDLLDQAANLNFQYDNSKTWLLDYRDEIGTMANSYNNFRNSIEQVLHNLNTESEVFSSRAQNLAAISEESVASMEEVKASVDEVASLSESNSETLRQTNASALEVSNSAISTSNAAQDGAATAANTAMLTDEATQEVNAVVDKIQRVGVHSKDSGESIQKVRASVSSIAGFVSTITGIADQTNLLALNAAIEAARAGELGRGFAVVADEVRKLAEESGKAAQEVYNLISTLQQDTSYADEIIQKMEEIIDETVRQANEAKSKLTQSMTEVESLSGNVQNIAAVAAGQAESSTEMVQTIDRLTEATMEVVRTLANIKAATGDTASASESVAMEAQGLTEGVEKLREIVDMFKYDAQNKPLKLTPATAPNKALPR